MNSLRTMACALAIPTGIAAIAYAVISGQTGIAPLAISIALIGAGVVVWRGGPIWVLLAIWAIAVVGWLLPLAVLVFEFHRVGVLVPVNLQVIAWSMRLILSLAGLALTITAQRKQVG
jgi:hypothetical protein